MSKNLLPTLHPNYRYFEKVRNTFLQCHWLWPLVSSTSNFYPKQLVPPQRGTSAAARFAQRFTTRLRSLFWFWPSLIEAQIWAEQSIEGDGYNPQWYVEMDPTTEILVQEVSQRASAPEAPILDLGCNCGRCLNALSQKGFTNLHGVDIGQAALDYMEVAFPGLRQKVKTTRATFQAFLTQTPNQFFAVVYTRGATVELVHPSFPLVRELARITQEYVILGIQENEHTYPRFWSYEFQRSGFVLVKLLRPCTPDTPRVSLLVYQRYLPENLKREP